MFQKLSPQLVYSSLCNLSQITFEITDACNLQCKYCGYAELYHGYDIRKNKFMPLNMAIQMMDYLAKIWKSNQMEGFVQDTYIGFYGGEPLLNMSFVENLIRYIEINLKDVGKNFKYNMTTNAMLLDKHMDYLAKKKINLLISLDGDKAAQSYRVDKYGNNSFDIVYRNINLLKNKYPTYFRRYVNFNSVLHDRNDIELTFNYIFNQFGKKTRISQLNTSDIRPEMKSLFLSMYNSAEKSYNDSLHKKELEHKMFITSPDFQKVINYIDNESGNVFNDYNGLLINKSQKEFSIIPTGTCIPFSKRMFITVNGKILQCEKISHDFSLGQVNEVGVTLSMEKIAKLHNKYIFQFIKQCYTCTYIQICPKCVFQTTNTYSGKKVICSTYSNAGSRDIEINNVRSILRIHPTWYKMIIDNIKTAK